MKKKSVFICALLSAFLMAGMTGCGKEKKPVLSGSYTSQSLLNQMNYTFDGGNGVTVRFLVGGFSVYSQTGTYEINKDGSVITFSFPAGNESAELPDSMTSLDGAFSFKEEKDCIWIGTVCYQKDTAGAKPEEAAQPSAEGSSTGGYSTGASSAGTSSAGVPSTGTSSAGAPSTGASSVGEEPVPLTRIHLMLPETYALSYEVTEESFGISRTYTQAIVCTDAGIFLDLGDSNEKYVFEKLDSGKYTQYRYNAMTGKYETTMISAAVQEQINAGTMTVDMVAVDSNVVAGYKARIDVYFDYYERFNGHMTYQGQETVEGVDCQKYAAAFTTVSGEQAVELWIEPQTGLCIREIYRYQSAAGVTGTKTILCTQMETENVALPAYR